MTTSPAEQREQALASAQRIRLGRADLRKRITSGEAHWVDVILDVPDVVETANVEYVLTSIARVGKVKAYTICFKAGVTSHRELGQLTNRQRLALVAEVTEALRPKKGEH